MWLLSAVAIHIVCFYHNIEIHGMCHAAFVTQIVESLKPKMVNLSVWYKPQKM